MRYVPCDVMFKQLQEIITEGGDLSEYVVADCDSFAGEAIIVPKEDDDE